MAGTVGRPRASSRGTLAEAACELFLEQGFDATSVTQITVRAGVSRSTFFNYFDSKSDIFWSGLDERIAGLERGLAADAVTDAGGVRAVVLRIADDFAPDTLALGVVNAEAMGIVVELEEQAGRRRARIASAVSGVLVAAGADPLPAEVAGAAWGGAVIASVIAWARGGPARQPLSAYLTRGADAAAGVRL